MTIDTPSRQEVKRTLKKVREAKRQFNNDWDDVGRLSESEKEALRRANKEQLDEVVKELEEETISEEQNDNEMTRTEGTETIEDRNMNELLDGHL